MARLCLGLNLEGWIWCLTQLHQVLLNFSTPQSLSLLLCKLGVLMPTCYSGCQDRVPEGMDQSSIYW